MPRRRFTGLIGSFAFTAIVGAAITWAIWSSRRPAQAPVPVAVAATEFVGIQTCAECHRDKQIAHARSGHSRTFGLTSESAVAKRLNGRTFYDKERQYEHLFSFDKEGLSVAIPDKFGEAKFPLQYIFGSGRHAVSFLTLMEGREKQPLGLEYRVTAFGSDEWLGLTPGLSGETPRSDLQHFGDILDNLPPKENLKRCIECHTTTFQFGNKEVTNLLPNVTCESCHGPGAKHVAAMRSGETEMHIRTSRSAQEQLETCGECHRRADRLGHLEKNDKKLVRFQPVGLSQSACFIKSGGKMSCSTCHDPHDAPSEHRPGYDQKCLSCHQQGGVSHSTCPVSAKEKCVECHMPRIEVHKGFVFSDHWIRVRSSSDLPAYQPRPADKPHAESK